MSNLVPSWEQAAHRSLQFLSSSSPSPAWEGAVKSTWFSRSVSRSMWPTTLSMIYCPTYPLSVIKGTFCFYLLTLVFSLNWFRIHGGKKKAIYYFPFSSLAASLSHSFFVFCLLSFSCGITNPTTTCKTHGDMYYIKKTCSCLTSAVPTGATVRRIIHLLLNSARLPCISPAVSTRLLYCVLSGAFHLSGTYFKFVFQIHLAARALLVAFLAVEIARMFREKLHLSFLLS